MRHFSSGRQVFERTVTIGAPAGLHARPAAAFVKAVLDTGAPIRIGRPGGQSADARSIVSVLALDFKHGEEAVLTAPSLAAVEALGQLLGRAEP